MGGYLLPVEIDWAEWERIFTDASMWRPVVERVWLVDASLSQVTGIVAPRDMTAGFPGTCAVWVVGDPETSDAAVIKIFPPMVARDHERELAVYRLLQGRVPGLPALLAEGVFHDRIDWPYFVMAYVAGEAWRDVRSRIPVTSRREIMLELGRLVRAVHSTPLPDSGTWPSRSHWEGFRRDRLRHAPAEWREGTALGESVLKELEAMLAHMDWSSAEPVLLHADLTEDHLLVSEDNGAWTMATLIDWADAEVGDPCYEWVALWFGICRQDAGLLRAFMQGYGLEANLGAEALLAFTVLHRFGVNIVSEILSPEEQRHIRSVSALRAALFPGLAR